MKIITTIQIITSIVLFGSVSAWAQTTTLPTGTGTGTELRELKARWHHMTPEQKEIFLKDHPKFAEWLAEHLKDLNDDTSSNDSSTNSPSDSSSDSTGDSSSNSQGTSSGGSQGASSGSSTGTSSGTTPSTPSQTTPSTSSSTTTGTTPSTTGTGNDTHHEKWSQMTPEQKESFLKNHPAIAQKFAQTHPDAEQRLATTQEAGAGIHDSGHPRVNEVNGRETDQQNRIAQGVKSGTLNPKEQAQLQRSGERLQKQEGNDLAKNDGHLTAEEKARLNHEENRRSRHIYAEKHVEDKHVEDKHE